MSSSYKQFIRDLACALCLRPPPSDPHHARTVGAHGDQDKNLVPLCRICHSKVHQLGVETIAALTGIDLRQLADALWEWWQEGGGKKKPATGD